MAICLYKFSLKVIYFYFGKYFICQNKVVKTKQF